jgi:hypothetical protein
VVFPDRYHYMITARLGPNFHYQMEFISVQGISYQQDGVHVDFGGKVTPSWTKKDPQNLLPVDPFKMLQSLRSTLTPHDLGDTTIGGIRVHHYAMEMDKAKLVAQETPALADPGLRRAPSQLARSRDRAGRPRHGRLLLRLFAQVLPGHGDDASARVLWSRPQREQIRAEEAERPPGCLAFTFWLIAYRWLVPDLELAGNTNRPIKT